MQTLHLNLPGLNLDCRVIASTGGACVMWSMLSFAVCRVKYGAWSDPMVPSHYVIDCLHVRMIGAFLP